MPALRPIGPDDFAVIDAGHPVGRIRRAAERQGKQKGEVWIWNITVNLPGVSNGTAGGIEPAKAAFRAAWSAFKAATPPAQLKQALQDAAAARERRPRRS